MQTGGLSKDNLWVKFPSRAVEDFRSSVCVVVVVETGDWEEAGLELRLVRSVSASGADGSFARAPQLTIFHFGLATRSSLHVLDFD